MRKSAPSNAGMDVASLWFSKILSSIRRRPSAWLLALWITCWAIYLWSVFHRSSWDAAWALVLRSFSPSRSVSRGNISPIWLTALAYWGQVALYVSTTLLALYVCYALWIWRQYSRVWMPLARDERFRGGTVLEVIVPAGSKADARAAADMFGQMWNLMLDPSHGARPLSLGVGAGSAAVMDAERRALSLEMWSTPQNEGKVGFYIWCPNSALTEQSAEQKERKDGKTHKERRGSKHVPHSEGRLVEEIRHLIMVHHPRCRVRWIDDPLETALLALSQLPKSFKAGSSQEGPQVGAEVTVRWYELGLIADSRYPIGSGVPDERLVKGAISGNRSGSPGAGSDALASLISMLATNSAVPVAGIQIVASARAGAVQETQQAVEQEIEKLRNIGLQSVSGGNGRPNMQAARKMLSAQQEALMLALEEKADRQGYDVAIRLVAAEVAEVAESRGGRTASGTRGITSTIAGRADACLISLLRIFAQYDRTSTGIKQGFRAVSKGIARIGRANHALSSNAAEMRTTNHALVVISEQSAQSQLRLTSPASPDTLLSKIGTNVRSASTRNWLREAAPVIGRWPRAGVCLPRLLPFMRIGRPNILNRSELAALYHFPHQGLEGLPSLRWSTYKQLPPPIYARVTPAQLLRGERVALGVLDEDLPPVEAPLSGPGTGSGLLLQAAASPGSGTSGAPDGHIAGLLPSGSMAVGTYPEDLRRGSYVLGPMGSGKSVLLYNAITQYMSGGRGVGLIDGKGDSYEEILRLVPPHMEGEVLTFDPENRRSRNGGSAERGEGRGRTSASGRSIGINPLDGRLVQQLGAEKVESLTMGLMRKMMGASWETAVLMQRFLRDAILAVLEVEPAPTMLNLWRWLQDDGKGGNPYRARMVSKIRNQLVKNFWQTQVVGMSSQQRSSMQNVLTRVDRYIKNDVRHVILQPYSTVNFREIMDQGTIFVGRVSPRLGEDQSFLGALTLNGFLTGAFARQSLAQEARRDYLLVVDEFQNFVDTARADVERMLSMARGYRLGLMLAHQFTEQVPREVLSAILKNVQTWVLFGLQADDARLFAGYMEGLRAEDFQNLPAYHTYQRTVVGNKQTGVYSARPLLPPLPAENLGTHFYRADEGEPPARAKARSAQDYANIQDQLRAANVAENISLLVRGVAHESVEAQRERIMKLAQALYWPAEEGDEQAVQALSRLTPADMELYRRARKNALDKQECERILARPQLVPDKAARIERLSELRWGTPCVEAEALVRAMLRQSTDDEKGADDNEDDEDGDGPTHGVYGV